MKKVLLLGAGLVAKPLVDYLEKQPNLDLYIGSRTLKKAQDLLEKPLKDHAFTLNMEDLPSLDQAIQTADLVISLVPYAYHVAIAKECLKYKKPLITTSYMSQDMQALDREAKKQGVLLLNEIGLDPGIDHMSAMRLIHRITKKGGKVITFRSYCGGLPHPKDNDNPIGYKFSWSPIGVLSAAKNKARFLEDGKIVEVPNHRLFATCHAVTIPGLGKLEAYPNRDALSYKDLYGLKDVQTFYRGTLRNAGWCKLWRQILSLNMLSTEKTRLNGITYRDYMASLLGEKGLTKNKLIEKLSAKLNLPVNDEVFSIFEWMGLFDNQKIPSHIDSNFNLLAECLKNKLRLKENERDMIVLHHEFIVAYNGKKEKLTSTWVDYGKYGGNTAMAKAVSLPAAVAAKLILEGKIQASGAKIPVEEAIYEPVLEELGKILPLRFQENTYPI